MTLRKAPEKEQSKDETQDQRTGNDKAPVSFLDETWSWSSPSTWPLSVCFLPFPVACLVLFFGVYIQHFLYPPSELQTCMQSFDYGIPIAKIEQLATTLATHDWEQGAAAEALLELYNPEFSVFGADPFPRNQIPSSGVLSTKALRFVLPKIVLGQTTLSNNTWGVADPASLGVFAVLAAADKSQSFASRQSYVRAVREQESYLLWQAPRYDPGGLPPWAISHRMDVGELWSDAMFMFPPFLAYNAVEGGMGTSTSNGLRQVMDHVRAYHDRMAITKGEAKGAWKHIVGPSDMADPGAWSTGNGWAAYGMARVRATIVGWAPGARLMQNEIAELDKWVNEIIEAATRTDDHPSGLLRNYLGDDSWFAETAGTALIAAAAYRLARFRVGVTGEERAQSDRLVAWADKKREAVFAHVGADGIAKPAVNSLKHKQREPLEGVNPEAESFLLLLASAWRDCVCDGVCEDEIVE